MHTHKEDVRQLITLTMESWLGDLPNVLVFVKGLKI